MTVGMGRERRLVVGIGEGRGDTMGAGMKE